MIINKWIGDTFVFEVDLKKVDFVTFDHQTGHDYEIMDVYDDTFQKIIEFDEVLLRKEVDKNLKSEVEYS